MKLHTPARKREHIFPPHAQRVASTAKNTDPSGELRRARLAVQVVLAASGETVVRTYRFLSAFAASLIAFAPIHALAQTQDNSVSVRDRLRSEYDPQGMRLGGFDLNATLDLGAASTDNLFAEETGEDADIVYTVTPSARLASHWSRHEMAFVAGANFKSHADFSSEDADTGYVGADGRLDVGRDSSLSARARYANEVESRTNPDALTVNEPVVYTRSELAVSARHAFSRFRVIGTAAQSEYDYDDAGALDQDFRDSDENSFTGRLEAEVTPRIGVVLQARADQRDYDNSPGLSSEGRTYLAGVSVDLTDLLRGEVTVGQFDRDYDSGGGVSGTAIASNLEWYVTRLTTINLSARRNGEDSGATVAQPYVESEYSVRVDHELLRNVILTAGARTGRREYEVIDREDEFMSGQIGADYLFNRRLVLQARFNHDETESNGANRYRDYEVNVLSLGASLRL